MRVLFTFGVLAHYYNPILNKLNKKVWVTVVVPDEDYCGSGVISSRLDIDFTVYRQKQYMAWYGKPFFRGFKAIISYVNPDIIVTCYPYSLAFVLNPFLWFIKPKIILKDIPFQLPKYNEPSTVMTEDGEIIEHKGIKLFLLRMIRKRLFNRVDAIATYIDAKDILKTYGVDGKKIFKIGNTIA